MHPLSHEVLSAMLGTLFRHAATPRAWRDPLSDWILSESAKRPLHPIRLLDRLIGFHPEALELLRRHPGMNTLISQLLNNSKIEDEVLAIEETLTQAEIEAETPPQAVHAWMQSVMDEGIVRSA
jgi:hypothetical protein